MTYSISKDFHWSSSHILHGLPPNHPCGRLHGHNYIARVTLTAPTLDPHGFVVDYAALNPLRDWINTHLDHRHLNDLTHLDGANPTAEHLARTLHAITHTTVTLPPDTHVTVGVSETPKTWATWT